MQVDADDEEGLEFKKIRSSSMQIKNFPLSQSLRKSSEKIVES
jgi:hypothetical protein